MDLRPAPVLLALIITALAGCSTPPEKTNADSAFAGVQARGKEVMGVDQYTSRHIFEDLPNGGRVILDRDDSTDVAAIAKIRAHMNDVLADFTAGDFSKPFHVHDMKVPGTDVMKANAASIRYSVTERPRGAELRIETSDPTLLAAIREFLEFQRKDHHAEEHEM